MAERKPAITGVRVLKELGTIAFAKQDGDGPGVKTEEKMKALELIGRHLGLFDGAAQEDEDDRFTVEVKVVD